MEHIHTVEFTCPILSVPLISLKAFFSRHEAILNNAFENHHGITRGTIKMIEYDLSALQYLLTLIHLPSE